MMAMMLFIFLVRIDSVVEAHECSCSCKTLTVATDFSDYTQLIGEAKEQVFLKVGHKYYPADANADSFCAKDIEFYYENDAKFSVRAIAIANKKTIFKGARIGASLEKFSTEFGQPLVENIVAGYSSYAYQQQKITVFYCPLSRIVSSVYLENMPKNEKTTVVSGQLFSAGNLGEIYVGSNLTYKPSETLPNVKLEQAIKEVYGMSEPLERTNYYYYNLIDLNNDKIPETFVYLVGPDFSGSGGDSALIFTEDLTGYKLLNRFSVMRSPIIVSAKQTEGWNDLLVQVAGGGTYAGFVELKFNAGKYPENPSLQKRLAGGSLVVGKAIFAEELLANTGIGLR